jgi:hypothetical protein
MKKLFWKSILLIAKGSAIVRLIFNQQNIIKLVSSSRMIHQVVKEVKNL